MNKVYRCKNYTVYDVNGGYIIHNTKLDFQQHHTHITNFHTCKYIIKLSINKTIPKQLSDYLIVSLIRLSNDKEYIENLKYLLNKNTKKKRRYHYKGE